MARRCYLTHVVTNASGFRGPQYFDGLAYAATYYGDDDAVLVACDVTIAQHATIASHPEVGVFPADLTLTIGVNLATVQAVLESYTIPSAWVTAGMTFKTLLRWLTRLFAFVQRYAGDFTGGSFFPVGITLESLVGDLTQTQRTRVTAVAGSLTISTAGITLTTTIRQALKLLADQLPGAPTLAGVAL